MKSLLARLRSNRLASTFIILAAVSVALVGGSFAAHGVRGQERVSDSSDATPPPSPDPSQSGGSGDSTGGDPTPTPTATP